MQQRKKGVMNLVMNEEEKEKNDTTRSSKWNNREDLALRTGELEEYFSELKKKLDNCH